MMSCHLIPTWHEWNVNAGDVMVTWFTSYANLVMPCWACALHVCMHGACAISIMGGPKYSNGLMDMQAHLNLRKLTASHFQEQEIPKMQMRTCQTYSPLHISMST